jgi:hypothetical protein
MAARSTTSPPVTTNRFRIDVFGEHDVHPPDAATVEVRDEELLIAPEQDSRKPVRCLRLRQLVPELRRQACDLDGVGGARNSKA